jgi:hypothetical protein
MLLGKIVLICMVCVLKEEIKALGQKYLIFWESENQGLICKYTNIKKFGQSGHPEFWRVPSSLLGGSLWMAAFLNGFSLDRKNSRLATYVRAYVGIFRLGSKFLAPA